MAGDFEFFEKDERDRTDLVCLNGEPAFRTLDYDCSGNFLGEVFTGPNGEELTFDPAVDVWVPGPCDDPQVDCVESQEWTYGIDNTGTRFSWADATYELELSDGTFLQWTQSTASAGGWTAQLNEWAANIQAAADDAGLKWLVEPRFIDNTNPTNLDGTYPGPGGTPSGLPGAPSVPVAQALFDGGMRWRYVNIQICPGQPVPINAVVIDSPDANRIGYNLTTAGAILGPIQKFFVCRECAEEPVWLLEDGLTLAEPGQIPFCWEPCGTLALAEAPPDRDCENFLDIGCDNLNQEDQDQFVQDVTRQTIICAGESPQVAFFTPDPADPAALVEYTMVGTFVDCSTGEPIPEPVPCIVTHEVDTEIVCINNCPAIRQLVTDADDCLIETFIGENGEDKTAEALADGWTPGACHKQDIDTCFLPDQYAIIWAWNGSGDITSYDPSTDTWTDWGKATLPDGTVVGGYALAFKNDTSEPTLFFQVNGTLYKSDPADPTALIEVGPADNASFSSSYPCLAFDPSGRILVGIGSGSTVGEVDPNTGEVTTLGPLIDVRDGALLQAGPGDWFFDPTGRWFLMARDNRGTTFGVSTGTVLWEIDPSTLEATRLGNTPAPTSGTGAAWLAANTYLLSTGASLYSYKALADPVDPSPAAWELLTTGPRSINDLANQWIIPDPVRVIGWMDIGCADPSECSGVTLFSLTQDEITNEPLCTEFPTTLQGKFGVCEPEGNPYVTDPFAPGGGSDGCETCPDQVWQEGCSDAGYTSFRRYYDASGNVLIEYLYGTLQEPVSTPPPGFNPIPCGQVVPGTENVTPFCTIDTNETIYRRQETLTDGTTQITWFDENGDIPDPDPANIIAGECDNIDPLLPVTEQIICYEDDTYVRRVKETYVLDAEGLPVLDSYEIIYFNEDGVLWTSGVLSASDPVPFGEPEGWYLGECVQSYVEYENERLCEIDARFLLLVDSGGAFAKYSFYDGSVTPVAIPVPSAGSGADIENFLLYAITGSQTLLTVDVNTNQIVSDVPLFSNDGSPTSFSAASFDNFAGRMLAWDYTTDNVYQINTATAEVSYFNGPWTGISGTGSSFAVNPVDGKFYVSGASNVYEIGNGAGDSGAATVALAGYSPRANGMTFDADGFLYTSSGTDTAQHDLLTGDSIIIIDDWTPAANSLAYYEVQAPQPACFHRRFGIREDGSRVIIGDFNVSDDSPRTIVGDINCCECVDCGGASGGGTGESGPDFEYTETLVCADGEPAFRRVSTVDENITTVQYLGVDGADISPTTWTPGPCVEEVSECSQFELATFYRLTVEPDGQLRNREWHDTEPTISTSAPNQTQRGREFRERHDFTLTPDTDNFRTNLNLDDTNNTAVELDVQVIDGYIIVDSPMVARYSNSSEGYWAVELGACCGPLALIAENGGFFGGREMVFELPAGIHRIRLWNIDSAGSNSSATFGYSVDGGVTFINDSTPPGIAISSVKPVEECLTARVCEDTLDIFDLADGSLLDINDLTTCPQACEPGSAGSAGSAGEELVQDFTTGLDSEFFNSAFTVPTAPVGTKEMVVYNSSKAWMEIETSIGTQIVPPGGTATWSVEDEESDLTVNSVSLISGTFSGNDTWGINYRTRT